jgi:AcrR family transcriptional regulator
MLSPVNEVDELPLRERKRLRTREALVDAAMSLFAEHGFDAVTVADIARRAEVGRTTFFRYFADKQEILFADGDRHREELLSAVRQALADAEPIGDSLPRALAVTRAGLVALAHSLVSDARWLPLRERLVRADDALLARRLLKERDYGRAAIEELVARGALPETAALAVNLAGACYATAAGLTADAPEQLPAALEAAFDRLQALH